MNTPEKVAIPIPAPSNGSGTKKTLGAALAIVTIFAFDRYGIDFPAGVETAVGLIIAYIVEFLPDPPRKTS
jgi:hypothetical protein